MEFESIYTITELEKLASLKDLIYRIKTLKPGMIISSLRSEDIGKEIIVSFRIDDESYPFMIEKLIYNNIRLLIVDKKNENFMEEIKTRLNKGSQDYTGWGAGRSTGGVRRARSVEEYISAGNYKEVIKLSKDISLSKTTVEKAKKGITLAVEVAIDMAYQDGLKNQIEVDGAILKLIAIASNKDLRSLNVINEMKKAGYQAIELCSQYKENYIDLINIANSSSIHNIVNIKAAVRFSQLVLQKPELFEEEIQFAIKTLNTRWLSIAIDTVQKDLSEEEITEFNKLYDFILERRKIIPQ